MPPLIRRYIKTSFAFLIAGLIPGLPRCARPPSSRPAGRGRRWAASAALGGLGQLLGAALFVINMWARVRMPSITPVK